MNAATGLSLANDIIVSLFGSILAAAFCGTFDDRRARRVFWWCALLLLPLLHGAAYILLNPSRLRGIYPFLMHVPLWILLGCLTSRWIWSFVCVLLAYLCCQLRRWIGLMMAAMLSGGAQMQMVVEIAISAPLLYLLLRYSAPSVRAMASYPARRQLLLGVIPALYYAFDYATRVYSQLLGGGNAAAVEFMPFVCCVGYVVFLVYTSGRETRQARLEQEQSILNRQLAQAVREIDTLRESQEQASRYRHDLRHHLQYLSACLENGQTARAQEYINGICGQLRAHKVRQYCENEAVNLLLLSFAARAEKKGITMRVRGSLPQRLSIQEQHLCVLLSNALENAINACARLMTENPARRCAIDVRFRMREGHFLLQITNPCGPDVRLLDGVPVTDRPGHGMGVRSMLAIVEAYDGLCSFSVQNGEFALRLSV